MSEAGNMSEIAESALESCQVQASRAAPISPIPVRRRADSESGWPTDQGIARTVKEAVLQTATHVA
jgi:hypothetical protein